MERVGKVGFALELGRQPHEPVVVSFSHESTYVIEQDSYESSRDLDFSPLLRYDLIKPRGNISNHRKPKAATNVACRTL
jgi:hypothetical protein